MLQTLRKFRFQILHLTRVLSKTKSYDDFSTKVLSSGDYFLVKNEMNLQTPDGSNSSYGEICN